MTRRTHHIVSHRVALCIAVFVTHTMLGCTGTLPDLRPFADSTVALQKATRSSFAAAAQTARDLSAEVSDEDSIKRLDAVADGFEKEASVRSKAFAALTAYSERLASIVSSAQNEQQKVRGVRENVSTLIGVASDMAGDLPGARIAGEGSKLLVDLIAQIQTEFIQARAAKDLNEAIRQADEYVGRIASVLASDLDNLRTALANAPDVVAEAIEKRDGHKALSSLRDQLLATRSLLASAAIGLPQKVDEHDQVDAFDRNDQAAYVQALMKALEQTRPDSQHLAAFLENEKPLKSVSDAVSAIDARRAAAVSRSAAGQTLVAGAARGLEAWRSAHADLADAIKQSRTVSLASLTAAIETLKKDYDRIDAFLSKVRQ